MDTILGNFLFIIHLEVGLNTSILGNSFDELKSILFLRKNFISFLNFIHDL